MTHGGGWVHSAFVTNCPAHCQTGTGGDWGNRRVGNTTNAEAVAAWWHESIGSPALAEGQAPRVAAPRWVERCDERPCNGDVC